MIALIEGNIVHKNESSAIVRCADIGYEIFIPQKKLSAIDADQKILFYIYHHITESSQLLFGFDSVEDRALFLQLISVSGVGPKTALQFFDLYHNREIIDIIIDEDLSAINKISGIGKKTAERIILELKDKLFKLYGTSEKPKNSKDSPDKATPKISYSEKEDIVSAFLGLGYQRKQLEQLINEHQEELSNFPKVEDSIKYLLGKL